MPNLAEDQENWNSEDWVELWQAMQQVQALPQERWVELAKDEQPQTLTLFCFQLGSTQRLAFLKQLDPKMQAMVVARLAQLKPVKLQALLYLYTGLLKKIGFSQTTEQPFFVAQSLYKQLLPEQQRWVLNAVQPKQPKLLAALVEPSLANLYALNENQVQQLLAHLTQEESVILFKPLGAAVHQKLWSQLPVSEQKWWKVALAKEAPVLLKSWQAVHQKSVTILKTLQP